jgi:hypothetical protein
MFGVRNIAASFLAIMIFGTGGWSRDNPVASRPLMNDEQLSVYRAFLDKFSFLHFKNLASLTIPFDFKGFPETRPCLQGAELQNLNEVLRTSHSFGPEMTKGRDLRIVDSLEQEKLRQRGDESLSEQGKVGGENPATNPKSSYLVLSEIAFDAKHQLAVLKYLLVCGQRCVSGATLVLEKADGTWTVSSRRPCAIFVGR